MTAIGDSSVEDDGLAAVWTTVTVAANDGGVVEIRLNLTRCHVVMQELSTYRTN